MLACPARHQVTEQFLLHPRFGAGVDPARGPPATRPAVMISAWRIQHTPPTACSAPAHRRRRNPREHPRRPRPPRRDQPVEMSANTVSGQPQRPHRRSASDLRQQRVQPQRPRIGLQLGQRTLGLQQSLQRRTLLGTEPAHDLLGEAASCQRSAEPITRSVCPSAGGSTRSLRHRCRNAAPNRPDPVPPGTARTQPVGPPPFVVLSRRPEPQRHRTAVRWPLAVRLSKEYFANSAGSTFTNPATKSTAAGGTCSP